MSSKADVDVSGELAALANRVRQRLEANQSTLDIYLELAKDAELEIRLDRNLLAILCQTS